MKDGYAGNNPKQAELHTLFSDIGSFICELKRRNPNSSSSENDSEPANKKRKIEDEAKQQLQVPTRTAISAATNANGTKSAANAWSNVSIQPAWKAQDVSFSIPQRKKLHMEIIKDGPKGASGGIRGVNTTSGAVEFGVSWKDVGMSIRYVVFFQHICCHHDADSEGFQSRYFASQYRRRPRNSTTSSSYLRMEMA